MEAKAQKRLLNVLVVLQLAFVLMCTNPSGEAELPLILSLPRENTAGEIGLVDSLLYILEPVNDEEKGHRIKLRRISLSDPGICDSLSFPAQKAASLNPELEIRLPQPGWAVLSLPIGDTSKVRYIGFLGGDTFPTPWFARTLIKNDELFYVVDMHDSTPRTIAVIKGRILSVEYPYLLLHASCPYIYPSGIKVTSVEVIYELIVVDLRDFRIVIDIPSFELKDYENDSRVRLTADGRLLYMDVDTADITWDDQELYLIEKEMIMRSREYLFMIHVLFRDLFKLATITGAERFEPVRNLFKQSFIPWRYYGIESRELLVWDIEMSDSARQELLLPSNALGRETETFLGHDGEVRFLSPSGHYYGWGFPSEDMPHNFVEVPAVSDFRSPPQEIAGFRQLGKRTRRMCWELSPEKRWLALYTFDGRGRNKEVVLVPIQALTDSTLLEQHKSFARIPASHGLGGLHFAPGENWVLATSNAHSPRFYHCAGAKASIPLLAPEESLAGDAFFSPDGRYVGYICRLEGENVYRLQVRRLPNPYP